MNAGAFGGSMADICQSSTAFDLVRREVVTFCGVEQCFGYRTSIYEKNDRYAILGAELVLRVGERSEIDDRMNDYLSHRRRTQPLEYPSAGSVFKRPEGYFAGKLIEDCGLKGVTVGGAQVSEKHAGFIVNRGGATAKDVRELVALIQDSVLERFGVKLECEICFL
jgi:UDP-N-acetylmuramate dehydrogenase